MDRAKEPMWERLKRREVTHSSGLYPQKDLLFVSALQQSLFRSGAQKD